VNFFRGAPPNGHRFSPVLFCFNAISYILVFKVQTKMSEEPIITPVDQLPSSEELIEGLEGTLEEHKEAGFLSDLTSELDEKKLREDAEREVYADTPAKELLWDAKSALEKLYDPDIKNIAWGEIAEAYAIISPEESDNIVNKIIHDEQYSPTGIIGIRGAVEMLAKLSFITAQGSYLDKARELAKKGIDRRSIDAINYDEAVRVRDNEIEQDLRTVARFGGDAKSMHILYQRASSGYYDKHSNWDVGPALYFFELAALGYKPAIDATKTRLIDLVTDPTLGAKKALEGETYNYLDKAVAGLILLEKQIQDGELETKTNEKDEQKIKKDVKYDIEQEWWKLVSERRLGVLKHLQNPHSLLPRFEDSLIRTAKEILSEDDNSKEILEKIEYEIKNGDVKALLSSLKKDTPIDKVRSLFIFRAIKEEAIRLHQEEIDAARSYTQGT
jgi:hypothetical protein